jgi:hypothetical protein
MQCKDEFTAADTFDAFSVWAVEGQDRPKIVENGFQYVLGCDVDT